MLVMDVAGTDPYRNLALEEYLFLNLERGESALLLWQNGNTVVVGRHQNTEEEIDGAFASENGVKAVRRITGGGAVYHDLGNLNFSFIRDAGELGELDFSAFTRPVTEALEGLGVRAEPSGRNDMSIGGRKCSGSAQTVRGGRVLHHGTLLFDCDLEFMRRVLTVNREKLASKGVESVRSRVTNILEHLPVKTGITEFKAALLERLSAGGDAGEIALSGTELEAVEALRREKYMTWEWNYGASPGYTARKERRFKNAGVTVLLEAKRGIIENIAIRGDFFGSRDIEELEDLFRGAPLRYEVIYGILEDAGVGGYISGVDARGLAELIVG